MGGVGGVDGWLGGVEKLILKLTSASTGVRVEARAELGNFLYKSGLREKYQPLTLVSKPSLHLSR